MELQEVIRLWQCRQSQATFGQGVAKVRPGHTCGHEGSRGTHGDGVPLSVSHWFRLRVKKLIHWRVGGRTCSGMVWPVCFGH